MDYFTMYTGFLIENIITIALLTINYNYPNISIYSSGDLGLKTRAD